MQPPLVSPREAALPSPRARIGHTPGFDGVLSESWSSRRRAAEGLSKPGGSLATRSERGANESHTEANGIQEEKEDQQHEPDTKVTDLEKHEPPKEAEVQLQTDPGPVANGASSEVSADMGDLNDKMSNIVLEDRSNEPLDDTVASTGESPAVGLPPELADLASVEWTYLDPQGQTQGESLIRLLIASLLTYL